MIYSNYKVKLILAM